VLAEVDAREPLVEVLLELAEHPVLAAASLRLVRHVRFIGDSDDVTPITDRNWDWLDTVLGREHLFSPAAQRGLMFARVARRWRVSARQVALASRRPLTPREVQHDIAAARRQARRADRRCEACGRLLPPRRRNDARACTPACAMKALRARERSSS
jgi:ferredoxin